VDLSFLYNRGRAYLIDRQLAILRRVTAIFGVSFGASHAWKAIHISLREMYSIAAFEKEQFFMVVRITHGILLDLSRANPLQLLRHQNNALMLDSSSDLFDTP